MFIITAKAPKPRIFLWPLAILLAGVSIALLLRAGGPKSAEPELYAPSDEARCAYLKSLGWDANPEPLESLRLTLPETLEEPYLSYNRIQLQQGFDLQPWLGETVDRYTYRISNYPGRTSGCQADLYLCGGQIIAGDVLCTGADGFIATLEYPDPANSEDVKSAS